MSYQSFTRLRGIDGNSAGALLEAYWLAMDVLLMWFKSWKTELIIFTMLFLAGAAFYHPIEYDNTMSRYALLSAMVDYGTLNIDDFQKQTTKTRL